MAKKKKSRNPLDDLILDLSQRFANIPNFNLVTEDEDANSLFNFVAKRYSDVQNLRSLYMKSFLPAVNKNIAEGIQMINSSSYKSFIHIDKIDMKDIYYETIRLGYVHLFHNAESFYNELLLRANGLFKYGDNPIKIEDYLRQKHSVDIVKHWKRIMPIAEKINWISNCVKHYDGYPLKEPCPHKYYELLFPKNQKITIEKDDFDKDVQSVMELYTTLMQAVFCFGMIKMFFEMRDSDLAVNNAEIQSKVSNLEAATEHLVKLFMNSSTEVTHPTHQS